MNIITIKSFDLTEFLVGIGIYQEDDVHTVVPSPIPFEKKRLASRPKKEKPVVLIDQNKYKVLMWPSLSLYNNGPLPLSTSKPCWQCRAKIGDDVIGCPLDHITQARNPTEIAKFREYLKNNNFVVEEDEILDYFETEGLFCGGTDSCVKAYIFERLSLTHLPKYRKALTLLPILLHKKYGCIPNSKPTLTSWTRLQEWGGDLTLSAYKASRGTLLTETTNIKRPFMASLSTFYSEIQVKN